MNEAIGNFVREMAGTQVSRDSFNLYADRGNAATRAANAIRRDNLQTYLERMAAFQPRVVLVGEAPGWRGCRLTGIPFTSEHVMYGEAFGTKMGMGYKKTAELPGRSREATSTMVWEAIAGLNSMPLLWNAYPFHPHLPGRPWSNRPPNMQELESGIPFIRRLLHCYGVEDVIAVGVKARKSLVRAGITAQKIRHPSHGGKREFTRGLLSTDTFCRPIG